MKNCRIKNWFKKNWLICFVLAIPAAAMAIYLPLYFCNIIKIIYPLIIGILAYSGTAFLGYISVWQNERLRKANSIALALSKHAEVERNVTSAVESFDLPCLYHIVSNFSTESANEFIRELQLLSSKSYSAKTKLLLNSDYNTALEDEPCFVCKKSCVECKNYVKALVLFRDNYNKIYNLFHDLVFRLTALLRASKGNLMREKLILNYKDLLRGLNSRVDQTDEHSLYAEEIKKLEIEKINDDKLLEEYKKIVELTEKVEIEIVKNLPPMAKRYTGLLGAYLVKKADGSQVKECKVREDYYKIKFYDRLDEEYGERVKNNNTNGGESK